MTAPDEDDLVEMEETGMSDLTTPAVQDGQQENETKLSAAEIADKLTTAELRAVAALHGAPAGVADIVANGWPRGTREWTLAYGLVENDRRGELRVTPLGYEVFNVAAERCPHPYEDVSLDDITAEVRALVDEVAEPAFSGAQVAVHAREVGPSFSHRVTDAGFALTERIAALFEHSVKR
jgi:hypothetical protein